VKTNASNALVNKANETSTPNASPPEKSCLKNAQKNSSTDLKMVASKNAENQLQPLEDVPFLLILSDEYLLKSTVCCVKLNETLKLTCVPVNVFPPLSTKTVRWKNNALAALPPRPLNDKSPSNAPMVPLDLIPLNSSKSAPVVSPNAKLNNQKLQLKKSNQKSNQLQLHNQLHKNKKRKPVGGTMFKVPPRKSPRRPKRGPIDGGDKLKINK